MTFYKLCVSCIAKGLSYAKTPFSRYSACRHGPGMVVAAFATYAVAGPTGPVRRSADLRRIYVALRFQL